MGTTFNPLNPFFLDFTGSGGSGPASGPAERFTDTFNNTTDWGSPSSGLYSLSVTALVHGKGTNPNVQVYELVSGSYEQVQPNSIVINMSGDITISALQTPDTRFTGLILIL
jgi:hypothetical protein